MADILGTLASNYRTVGSTTPSKTPYFDVDPANYEGKWSGKYADKKSFSVTVSNVTGFRAKVKYESGATVKYQDVLIRDNAFRIADTKFALQRNGQAQIKTAVTDPATGGTYLDTAYASRK